MPTENKSKGTGRVRSASLAASEPAPRRKPDLSLAAVRSALTNGSKLMADVDGRTAWAKRFRDLLYGLENDLGSEAALSEGQRAIIRRAAMLELQLEMLESRFAENDGAASPKQLEAYGRASSTLRRLLESVGLHLARGPRDVTNLTPRILDAIREVMP